MRQHYDLVVMFFVKDKGYLGSLGSLLNAITVLKGLLILSDLGDENYRQPPAAMVRMYAVFGGADISVCAGQKCC